ncbi:hypothetical protein B0H10DRAFT_2211958 [Mycena sp. CBHHK59/15]|nr:hypothetical protein B0H10DRAFT_2211958 [Mycena sp. CBHHK59/15]
MRAVLVALTTGILLVCVNAIADDGSDDQQQCVLGCSLAGIAVSDCVIEDTPCICASSAYAANVTQCATSTCNVTADDVKGVLADGCSNSTSGSASVSASQSGSGSSVTPPSSASQTQQGSSASQTQQPGSSSKAAASASGSAPAASGSGKPNSAVLIGGRTELAAATVVGLLFCALLV